MNTVLSFDPAIKNIGWSISEINNESKEFKILQFGIIDITQSNKKKKQTTQEYCAELIRQLKYFETCGIDFSTVIIENQPSFKNPIVKSVQTMLMTVFISLGKDVILQSPSSKLFGMKFDKKKYERNKLFSIKMLNIVADKETMKEINKHNKIDDICDACLIGLYYLVGGKRPKELDELFDNISKNPDSLKRGKKYLP